MMKLYGVQFKQSQVLTYIFWVNLLICLPLVFEVRFTFGVDYTAYIQQASAVWNGERDYSKISSQLGPAYYPAGHLWHYVPAYLLHMHTSFASQIIKAGHFVIYSLIIVYSTKIAYLYHSSGINQKEGDNRNPNAQLIGMILLANFNDKHMYKEMFNDELMMLYMLIAIYYMLKQRPFVASFFVTLALSIKAGVILILPAFLGSIQYNYGTRTLLKSVLIIFAF